VLVDSIITDMRAGMQAGVVQPRALMVKVVPQYDAIIKAKPEDSVFWGPIAKMPKDFSDADKARLTAAYRDMIGQQIMPSFRKLRDFIATITSRPRATPSAWTSCPTARRGTPSTSAPRPRPT
jgi:uncharacterized protein (DUF885 family)